MLQEGERVLQRIIERKSKRAMAKNIMSTHAMQAISVPGEAESVQETESSAFAVKMSLIQEVKTQTTFDIESSHNIRKA
jgi:hypothetical protein